ncbi:uncharacterized protein BX664DRAFT_320740 [Halteromyces radiatus]|uniref:uncharacterized protein n=1 Tax=Halteromyces radiatus TaxID=101107 RepID=UPI00221FC30F|nr:uncharacterized protein BX664DRAFT_320740 [Halteromyces radiatus]KAI8099233.1 hypothetical protein BX664DRAFT_320740 [Halteromyces radiatus]
MNTSNSSSFIPATETIPISNLTDIDHDAELQSITNRQTFLAEAAQAAFIANMSMDDDSKEIVAPSVQKKDHSTNTESTSSHNNTLFDIPCSFLQRTQQILIPVSPQQRENSSNNKAELITPTNVKQEYTIFLINAHQYNEMQAQYARHPLPADDILFPWLHGIDGTNYQQSLFFGVRRMVVPKHRGLVLIHADHGQARGDPFHSRLVQSFLPSDIITCSNSNDDGIEAMGNNSNSRSNIEVDNQWTFRQADQKESTGIHLRNFKIQPWRYASISDIVIYGKNAESIAQRIAMAQTDIHHKRQLYHDRLRKTAGKRAIVDSNDLSYRIFIITDTFDVFENHYPELVWYNSLGHVLNNICFLEREKTEMQEMTSATELTENIWLGNTFDAPASINSDDFIDMKDDHEDMDIFHDQENPHGFSVCIECHDLSDMPLPSILTLAKETLNELGPEEMPSEIIHLDMYSTGSIIESSEQLDRFLDNLLSLLQFMDTISQGTVADNDSPSITVNGRRILIHCSDGYTETSILALSWVMYKLKLPLPKAYLYLQDRRSFFVLSTDVPLLRRIEQTLFEDNTKNTAPSLSSSLTLQQEIKFQYEQHHQLQKRKRVDTMEFEESSSLSVTSSSLPLDHHITSTYETNSSQHLIHYNKIANICTDKRDEYIDDVNDIEETISTKSYSGHESEEKDKLPVITSSPPNIENMRLYPWFYSPRFEGSFPSRIMPFLYLGNLNHATNPDMLQALGITHVVSVGENASLNQDQFKLLFLDNLYDDGIDSIRSRFEETMAFIDEAYAQGTKCLIHCRVGVSRSAAVTICYVMHHFQKMSLVDAYIFVRARRLNVIIQPNLKFMYEMLQLEQHLTGNFSLSWPVLCHEIHLLNQNYDEN